MGGKSSEHAPYHGNKGSILPVSHVALQQMETKSIVDGDNPLEVQPTPGLSKASP